MIVIHGSFVGSFGAHVGSLHGSRSFQVRLTRSIQSLFSPDLLFPHRGISPFSVEQLFVGSPLYNLPGMQN